MVPGFPCGTGPLRTTEEVSVDGKGRKRDIGSCPEETVRSAGSVTGGAPETRSDRQETRTTRDEGQNEIIHRGRPLNPQSGGTTPDGLV